MELGNSRVDGIGEVNGNKITGRMNVRKMTESILDKVKIHGEGWVGELPEQEVSHGTEGGKEKD